MCGSGAPSRQLCLTAGARSCREGGHSQISRFLSAESAVAVPHYDRQRADTTTSVPQPGVRSRKARVVPKPPRAGRGEYINTSVVAVVFGRTNGRTAARSPSQARLVSVVWRRRGVTPVFRPDLSMAGKIKTRRFGGGSAELSPRPYGSRTYGGWR